MYNYYEWIIKSLKMVVVVPCAESVKAAREIALTIVNDCDDPAISSDDLKVMADRISNFRPVVARNMGDPAEAVDMPVYIVCYVSGNEIWPVV